MVSRSLVLPAFCILVFALASCSRQDARQQLLTERIQYDVPVSSSDPQLDWWVNNIEGSRREPFLKRIVEAAEKGEVRVYDYFNEPLTPDQVLSLGTDTVYQTLLRSYPPYEEYDTMIVNRVTWRDITKIRFIEEWTWAPGDLQVSKKVLGLGPVIQRQVAGESYNQLLFWIYTDDRYPAR